MVISIERENALDKIQHPFMIKALNKEGTEGMYLNITKAVHDKITVNIILNGKSRKHFFLDQKKDKNVYSCHFYST